MTTETTPEQMTISELQTEIGKLMQILHHKITGDTRRSFAYNTPYGQYTYEEKPCPKQ